LAGQIRRMNLKVCLVGEPAVGKTSLLHRYVYNAFDAAYRATLGGKLYLLSFSKYITKSEIVEAQIALFDLMGQHAAKDAFRDSMFWGAHGFLAVADLTRPETLYELRHWVEAVQGVTGDIPFAILLNKSDLIARTPIGPRETQWLLATFPQTPYALTSAKTGEGVGYAFESLLNRMVDGLLAQFRQREERTRMAQRVLEMAKRRGAIGVTTTELLASLRGMDIRTLTSRLEDLQRLGYVVLEEIGPGRLRVLLTSPGEEAVRTGLEDVVVEGEP